jgi:translation initiation factor 4A
VNSFDDMALDEKVLHGVYSKGWEHPSPIQAKTICTLASGRDVIAQAQSGTGKTGAFTIGALARFKPSKSGPTIVALEPVRELAHQTAECFAEIGKYMRINSVLCIGGTSMQDTKTRLKTADVVVGTPGRILDLMQRGWLTLAHVRTAIIDEADEMLSHGFIDDIRTIVNALPVDAQVSVFSATFSPDDLAITRKFAPNAVQIMAKQETLTLAGIRQFYVAVERDHDKLDVLLDLFADLSIGQCVVFANTRQRVEMLCAELNKNDFTPVAIHSEMTQQERQAALNRLRTGDARVLVSSNLVARGIDIVGISCVFNYDLPRDTATYLHRIGRAGRYGKKGTTICLVEPRDIRTLQQIEQFYETSIQELPSNIVSILRGGE